MQTTQTLKIYSRPRSAPSSTPPTSLAEYKDPDAALTFAAESVMNELFAMYQMDQTARALYDVWLEKGTHVWIEPDNAQIPFDDVDFARLIVLQITLDYSHPVYFEVNCVDRLNMPSGASSPPSNWTFWVKAPETYRGEGIEGMMRRATEVVYEDMSRKAYEAEGSSYTLLSMKFHEVTEPDAIAAMAQKRGPTLYYVQNDGGFATTPQAVPE